MSETPVVDFAVGSHVSPGYFKSSFARSIVTGNSAKSLDFVDNGTRVAGFEDSSIDNYLNNYFFSLVNLSTDKLDDEIVWTKKQDMANLVNSEEVEKLKKQCQSLASENQRLQNALATSHVPHVKVIDNVCLQTQVDTLQWQLKQMDSNRQMYRSVMEQVVRFLGRAHKSLGILHEKTAPKDKRSLRVPRSRSVHAMYEGTSSSSSPSVSPSSSSCNSTFPVQNATTTGSSRFIRAKSATQISPSGIGFREFTWSMLRRNDPAHGTQPRSKNSPAKPESAKNQETTTAYQSPKKPEMDPNDVPPIKLSQEAYRLMRTVQSLLAMREPDLARLNAENDTALNAMDSTQLEFQRANFANSTTLPNTDRYEDYGSSSSSNDGHEAENVSMSKNTKVTMDNTVNGTLQTMLPGARRSIDTTSLNSGSSSKEDELQPTNDNCNSTLAKQTSPSTFGKQSKEGAWLPKSKPTNSVSSVEDESGFSSLSSFQEVGLPAVSTPKGCHTEVGLPEVPLDKVRHRRWSSTPVEFRTAFKRHSANLSNTSTTSESLSVWV